MLKLNFFLFAILFILIIFVYYKLYIYKPKEHMMPTTELDKVVQPVKYDIIDLEKVYVRTSFRYGVNTNHLKNDGRKICHTCTRYLDNRAIIDGYRYGLSRIEWHNSVLSWNGKKVGLELHVINSMVESQNVVKFVIPLSLVDTRESYVDLNNIYDESDEEFSLNYLIKRPDQVPTYQCCDYGKSALISMNYCPIANIILNQDFFYKFKESTKITWYITYPQLFNRIIGQDIINKIVG